MDKLRVQITQLETFESAKELVGTSQIATFEDGVTAGELAGLLLVSWVHIRRLYLSRSVTRRLKIAVRMPTVSARASLSNLRVPLATNSTRWTRTQKRGVATPRSSQQVASSLRRKRHPRTKSIL